MACINPQDPRFQEILKRQPNPLLAELEYDRLYVQNSPSPLQGVEKLFEEDKNLANAVYEALGFDISNTKIESLNKLNTHLESYLKQFGFKTEQLDDLKQATGYSIIGATDFLEKTIFVQKENINKAYSKEAAYAIFNLLGKKNLLRKDLIASIHLVDNYESLKSQYANSKLSDYKIRELIAVDYLQNKLIEAHKEVLPTTNKAVSKDVTAKNKLEYIILRIKKWWSDIIRKFFKSYKRNYIEDVFNQIANDIINNNTRLFNLSKEVSYKKMELTGVQKEINDNLVKLGAINSGSYSLNRQGTLTRENINDLDYFLPYEIKDEFIKNVVKIYPQAVFSEPYSGVMGNRSLTLSLKIDDVKIDFFLPTSQEESDKNKIIVIDGVKYHHWKNIFDAKIRIGSKKHLSDLAGFTPFNREWSVYNINWRDPLTLKDDYLNIVGQRHYNFDFIQSKYNPKEYSSDENVNKSNNIKTYWDKNLEQTALTYFKDNNIDFEKSIQYQDLLSYFNNKKDKAVIAYYLTFSENFKKFYGNIDSRKDLPSFIINSVSGKYSKNSILLDENGEPVIFYHGAGTIFDKFSKDYFLSGEGAMAYGAGFYSTNHKPTADNYRDTSKAAMETFRKLLEEQNKQLLELIEKLKIDINEENLIGLMMGSVDIEDTKSKTELLNLLGLTETKALYIALTNPLYWQKDISKENKNLIESHFGVKLKNNNSGQIYRELQKTLKISDKELSARLYQIGIDGVIRIAGGGQAVGGFSHKKGEKHVIFFEPIQAKAVNNSGLFSLNNENMYDPIEIKDIDANKNNQIILQQKATAQQLYAQYLEQNPNGSVEGFKSWVGNNPQLQKDRKEQFKNQEDNSFQQFQQSLNNPNTNPILQGNQQEQVKKFNELQERLNNKEFLEGAKFAFESSEELQELGTQEQYNDFIARVSLGIIKNPSSGEYNYESKVRDIVYRGDENFNVGEKLLSRVGGNKYTNGIYFTKSRSEASGYVNDIKKKFTHVFSAILDLKNPKVTDVYDKEINTNAITEDQIDSLKSKGIDGLDIGLSDEQGFEYLVFEPEQIHILSSKADIQGFKEFVNNNQSNIQYQKQIDLNSVYLNTSSSRNITISPQLKKLLDEFLDQIGVDSVSVTKELMEMNLGKDVRGIADLTAGLIGIVEGLEYTDTFVEEGMHFVEAIIKQKDIRLWKDLIKAAELHPSYQKYFDLYKNRRLYQRADGSPNVLKIKRELAGKFLKYEFIKRGEKKLEPKSILQRIINFFRHLFSRERDVYQKIVNQIFSGKFSGHLRDVYEEEDSNFYDVSDDAVESSYSLESPSEQPTIRVQGVDGKFYNITEDQVEIDTSEGYPRFFLELSNGETVELLSNQKAEESVEKEESTRKVISFLKTAFERAGINFEELTDTESDKILKAYGGVSNAFIDLVKRVVKIGNGASVSELTEEAAHLAIAILKTQNPTLFKRMLSKVNFSETYQQVLNDPFYRKAYVNKDGSLNILALKEEALGKLLANVMLHNLESDSIQKEVESWWERFMNWFRDVFRKAGFDFRSLGKTLEDLGMQIMDESFWEQNFDVEEGQTLYSHSQAQSSIKDKISRAVKNGDTYELDNITYTLNSLDKRELEAHEQSVIPKLKEDLYNTLERFIDGNGKVRTTPLPTSKSMNIRDIEDSFVDQVESVTSKLIAEYPEGTEFLYNVPLFDEKTKTYTVVDLIAIEPSGAVSVRTFDLLFFRDTFSIDKEKRVKDKTIFDLQENIGKIKQLLRHNYDIQDFSTFRSMPFYISFLKNNQVFLVDYVTTPFDSWLSSIPSLHERGDNTKINNLLNRLTAALNVLKDSDLEYKTKKKEIMNLLHAIINLQVKRTLNPVIMTGKGYIETAEGLHKKLKQITAVIPENMEEVNKLSVSISNIIELLQPYMNIDVEFREDFPQLEKELYDLANSARRINHDLSELLKQFVAKYAENAYNVKDLLAPEKSVDWLGRNFLTLSYLPTQASQVLYKILQNIKNETEFELNDEIETLETLRTVATEWANRNGKNVIDIYELITKPDEENVLIDEYQSEFYTELKNRIKKKDTKWILANIDTKAFRQYVEDYKARQLETINAINEVTTADKKWKEQLKTDLDKMTDLKRPETWLNYMFLRQVPADHWKTPQYVMVESTPALKALYDYIKAWNKRALNAGYLSPLKVRTFLPFIRKSFAEKLFLGGSFSPVTNFIESLTLNESTVGYGQFDAEGKLVNKIPVYFTTRPGVGNLQTDLSRDIFKNMAMYVGAVIKYEKRKSVEGYVKALQFIEHNKDSLQVDRVGRIIRNHGQVAISSTNETNAQLLDNFVKSALYDQRYVDETETPVGAQTVVSVYNNVAKTARKVGINLPSIDDDTTENSLSSTRLMESMNKFFSLTALGFNFSTALSQLFGGTFQGYIQGGRYNTAKEFLAAEWDVITQSVVKNDESFTYILMKHFLPLVEGQLSDKTRKLSLSALNRRSFSDIIMILMRKGDHLVQYANYVAMMKNAIVIDGKVYNAREYYRNSDEYKARYKDPNKLKELEREFDKKVKELIDTHGLDKHIKIVNGKPVLDNVDMKTFYDYRSLVHQNAKILTGNMSAEDEIGIRMSIIGRSFMVFKSWMLRPIAVRFSPLERRAATDHYEWGRYRTLGKFLLSGAYGGLQNIYNVLKANEKGLESMRQLFAKEAEAYKTRTNKELNLDEEQFFDLVRENLNNAIKDALFFLTLTSIFLSLSLGVDDDDLDDETKPVYRYALRTIDKIADEISFYYNPLSFQQLLSGSLFPALGTITNASRAVYHIGKEVLGVTIGSDELQESAKPMKYIFKTFPVSNQLLVYLSIFTPDLANDLGVRLTSQSRVLR